MAQHDLSFKKIRSMLWGEDNSYIQFLRRHRDLLFYSYPYPGNPGDDLIKMATELLLKDLDIRLTQDIMAADICMFAGGCPTMWPDVMSLIETYLQSDAKARLVIGPATFEFGFTDWPQIFKKYSTKIAGLFARDWKSFRNLQSANLPESIVQGQAHDPVFYLLGTSWHAQQRLNLTADYVLVALRRDHEISPGIEERILKPIIDRLSERRARKLKRWTRKRNKKRRIAQISRLKEARDRKLHDIDIWLQETESYLNTIRKASLVCTDRLHVMIVSAMLGKKVYAFSTSYGKLEHVYQTSMKGWADVTFWE